MASRRRDPQPSLFPDAEPLVRFDEAPARARTARPAQARHAAPPESDVAAPQQELLFTDTTILRSSLERAISMGEHAAAVDLRERLRAAGGDATVPRDLEFLEVTAAADWTRGSLRQLVATWHAAEALIATPARQRQVADGLFLRIAERFGPEEVAVLHRCCLEDLIGALLRHGQDAQASALVRDALLRGCDVGPAAVGDSPMWDVMAEDGPPERLACIGAVRRAWSVPRPDADEIAAVRSRLYGAPPADERRRGLAFWDCLRVAELRGDVSEDTFHAARARMKLLDPELHAEYLERLS